MCLVQNNDFITPGVQCCDHVVLKSSTSVRQNSKERQDLAHSDTKNVEKERKMFFVTAIQISFIKDKDYLQCITLNTWAEEI